MPEPFIQQEGEAQAYAVEPSKPNEHHLQTDDADMSAAIVTEQPQFGLATVGGKRVLVGALQFTISTCSPKAGAIAGTCYGNGFIMASEDSLLSSQGMFALKEGDEGQCFGIAQSDCWPHPPIPVVCSMCIGKGKSGQRDHAIGLTDRESTDEDSDSSKAVVKHFFAKLVRDDGTPISGAKAIARATGGNEKMERPTDHRGEVSFPFEADECDICFPEYDVSNEKPSSQIVAASLVGWSSRLLRKGSQSFDVTALQLKLNTRLNSRPKLVPDGVFGTKTEKAVRDFQTEAGISSDGIVGPFTQEALAAEPVQDPSPELKKFLPLLGSWMDFTSHVEQVWEGSGKNRETFFSEDSIRNFIATKSGKRYLLVKDDPVAVIDFRHFFAAASLSFSARNFTSPISGSAGKAELAGLGNEVSQCITEALQQKLNSCFSSEDLGSNRIGAQFGRMVRLDQWETPIPDLFHNLVQGTTPLQPDKLIEIRLPTRWDLFLESILALVHGLDDLVFPEAY